MFIINSPILLAILICFLYQQEWFFIVVDIIAVLTVRHQPRKFWNALKTKLKEEGSQLATNCSQLKMKSGDGKYYLTDVGDTKSFLRLIPSIPTIIPIRTSKTTIISHETQKDSQHPAHHYRKYSSKPRSSLLQARD